MRCAFVAERIHDNISRVIEGKPEVARSALVVLLAGGHLLIEECPEWARHASKALAAPSTAPCGGSSSPPICCPRT